MGQGTFDQMSTSGIDFSNLLKRDKEDDIGDDELFQIQESAINFHSDKNDIGSMLSLTSIGTEFQVCLNI